MIKTRFTVLNDDRGLLLGKDVSNIFKKGVVYGVRELISEFEIIELGASALGSLTSKKYPNLVNTANEIIKSGDHLYTEDEMKELL